MVDDTAHENAKTSANAPRRTFLKVTGAAATAGLETRAVGEETTSLTVENAASMTDDRPAIGYDLEVDGSKTACAEVVEILQGLGP